MFLGLCSDTWVTIGSVATTIGTLVAAVGLVGAWISIRQNAIARELEVFEGIFRDIRELDRQYISSFKVMTPEEQTAWSASFFNTVEYLCFANGRFVHNKALRKFFLTEALPEWRALFDKHVAAGIIGDRSTSFSEFKKAAGQNQGSSA